MKILALGGAGDMGRMAVATLLSSPSVSAITIGDKNYEVAKKYVELANSDKLSAIEIDITDKEKLHEVISAHDLVVNTVGPFYKYGVPILKAVIKAKKNYVDICDDWKPILEMLSLSDAAKEAGVTAIVGIGASPGITNLMAVKACSELDEVDKVVTGWGLGHAKAGKKPPHFISKKKLIKKSKNAPKQANAAILHLIHESIGRIPTYREGKLIEIESLTDAEPLKFPGGGRGMYTCHIGHPESVTLSRTLKANSISNVMYLTKYLTDQLRTYVAKIKAKQLTDFEVAISIEKGLNSWTTKVLLFFWFLIRFFKIPPELCVLVTGTKNGQRKKVAVGIKYRPYGEVEEAMDGITAVPMTIAALMVIEGKITKRGVLTPEEAIDPDEFFDRYATFCKKNLKGHEVLIKKVTNL